MLNTLVFLLFSLTVSAQTLPQTTIEKINGFEVHLVNVGRGDTIGVAFYVPFGSLHDTGHRMGRAHFLEHYVHNGSVRYPGYQTFKDLLKPAGVSTNAYTALDHTYYFASGKQENAKLILNVHLAMLGGSERNVDTFGKEVHVVINEIDDERMPAENSAMSYMTLLHLLPPEHPWAQYPIHGNRENLSALTMTDMMDLYERYYTPSKVKVAVFGNFAKPESLANIREILKQALIPASNPKPADSDLVPSLFSTARGPAPESETRLLVGAKELRQGELTLELDLPRRNDYGAAAGLIQSYLALNAPGSLLHKLQTEKGWVTQAGTYFTHFQNRSWLTFSYEPTEAGMEHVEEIEAYFYKALGEIRRQGIPDSTLKSLKKFTASSAERMTHVAQNMVQEYASVLADQGSLIDQIRDMDSVTNELIRTVIDSAHPRRALYATLMTDQAGMSEDVQFKRGFKIVAMGETLGRYEASFFLGEFAPGESLAVELVAVDLADPAPVPSPLFVQSRPEADAYFRMTLDIRRGLPDNATSISLVASPSSPESLLVMDVFLEAFRKRFAGELAYLALEHDAHITLKRDKNMLTVSVEGSSRNGARALEWTWRKLVEFLPSDNEVLRAKETIRVSLQNEYSGQFSAFFTVYEAFNQMDPYRMSAHRQLQGLELVPESWALLTESFRKLIKRAHKEIYLSGSVAIADLEDVLRQVRVLSPSILTKNEYANLAARYQKISLGERVEAFPVSRPGDGFGAVRIYRGPEVSDLKAAAAFLALASLVDNKVSTMNRDLLSLGYVHNATASPIDKRNYYLIIYGQTEGWEKTQKIFEGWEDVLTSLRDGSTSDSEIQDAIGDVLSAASEQKTSARQFVAEYEESQRILFDGRMKQRLVEQLRGLTTDDVRAVAEKFVTGKGVQHSQLTLGNCESLLKR